MQDAAVLTKTGEESALDLAIDTSLPVLPVETPEFSADPDPFLEAARAEHRGSRASGRAMSCMAIRPAGICWPATRHDLRLRPNHRLLRRPRHDVGALQPHICIGQFIARDQLQEGMHAIAQRLHNPRIDGAVEWRPFLGAWGLKHLPIAFDTA
jgi:hypothetical protein